MKKIYKHFCHDCTCYDCLCGVSYTDMFTTVSSVILRFYCIFIFLYTGSNFVDLTEYRLTYSIYNNATSIFLVLFISILCLSYSLILWTLMYLITYFLTMPPCISYKYLFPRTVFLSLECITSCLQYYNYIKYQLSQELYLKLKQK